MKVWSRWSRGKMFVRRGGVQFILAAYKCIMDEGQRYIKQQETLFHILMIIWTYLNFWQCVSFCYSLPPSRKISAKVLNLTSTSANCNSLIICAGIKGCTYGMKESSLTIYNPKLAKKKYFVIQSRAPLAATWLKKRERNSRAEIL